MCWDVSVARARAGVLEGDGSDLAPGSAQWPWEGPASGGGGAVSDLHLHCSVGHSSPGRAVCGGHGHSSVGRFEIQGCPGRGRHLSSAQPAGQKD